MNNVVIFIMKKIHILIIFFYIIGCSKKRGKRPLRLESDSDDDVCSSVKKIKLSKQVPDSVGDPSKERRNVEKRINFQQEVRTSHREVSSSKRAASPIMTAERRRSGLNKVSDPISVDISADESGSSKDNVSHAAPSKSQFIIEKVSSGIYIYFVTNRCP